jgi:HD-like signal output (HDOD) protein
LSAKILRLANSAFYGVPRTISNITDAVVLLGMKVVGTLVVSLSVFDIFPATGGGHFDRRRFWHHSLVCAVAGRLLARRVDGQLDPEDAFCGCLLHDIGKIVMDQYLRDDMERVMSEVSSAGVSFLEAEKALLEYTHVDVASWLTANWNLPSIITEPIIGHHAPAEAGESFRQAVTVAHLADHISYDTPPEGARLCHAPPLDASWYQMVPLSPEDMGWVKARIEGEMGKMTLLKELFRPS